MKDRLSRRRTGRRTAKCKCCGRFIQRPSETCGHCGHAPLPHNCDVREVFDFDRAHGWEE